MKRSPIMRGTERCDLRYSRGQCPKGEVRISVRRESLWKRKGLSGKVPHYDGASCKAGARGLRIYNDCLLRMQEQISTRLPHTEMSRTLRLPYQCPTRDSRNHLDLMAAMEAPIKYTDLPQPRLILCKHTRHSSDFQGATKTAIRSFHYQ